jgi:hypothetical protein
MSRNEDESDYPEVRPVRRGGDDFEDSDIRPSRRSRDLGDDPAMRLLMPVGTSGWAIAAGYLGLFSVLCLPAPLALITGILAIVEMHNNPKKHGMGRAVFGIIMGTVGSLVLLAGLISMIAR